MVHDIELVLALLVAVVALAALAGRISVPYPLLLVIGGLVLALIPAVPRIDLEPDLVFLLFLPPLLYAPAWMTSWRDFRANARPISLLAVGLVVATMSGVAAVAHAIVPGLPWGAAFALGAIVSPTDTVAATAIAQQLGVPRRIVTVLEGESLVNDATGLVAYRVAVAAVVTGVFSLADAVLDFFVIGLGGIAIGLAIAFVSLRLLKVLDETPIEIAVTLITPYACYLAAEELHLSGVLATVAAGLYGGRNSATVMRSYSRLEANAVWTILLFLFNGFVFILIGLQLQPILEDSSGRSLFDLVWQGALVSLTVMAIRVLWVFPATYLPRWFSARLRAADPYPPWRSVSIVSWAGMRGVISLAAALSLPLTTDAGEPFPERDAILFATFATILTTLLIQGLTLPVLIKRFGIVDDGEGHREESRARLLAARAAITRLESLVTEPWADVREIEHIQEHYRARAMAYACDCDPSPEDLGVSPNLPVADRLQEEARAAERDTIIRLRDDGEIADEVMRRIERDLDLEAVTQRRTA